MNVSYALIADIVRSRELPDRRRAQQVIYEALERAAEGLALTRLKTEHCLVAQDQHRIDESLTLPPLPS